MNNISSALCPFRSRWRHFTLKGLFPCRSPLTAAHIVPQPVVISGHVKVFWCWTRPSFIRDCLNSFGLHGGDASLWVLRACVCVERKPASLCTELQEFAPFHPFQSRHLWSILTFYPPSCPSPHPPSAPGAPPLTPLFPALPPPEAHSKAGDWCSLSI